MTSWVERIDGSGELDDAELAELGEQLRAEAERRARDEPAAVRSLVERLRQAGGRDPRLRPWAGWAAGLAEHLNGRPAAAHDLLGASARGFRRRGDEHTAARVELTLMDALACLGRHRSARRRGRRALEVFDRRHDRLRMASALLNLGGLADARDRVRDAVRWWSRAERILAGADPRRAALIQASLAGADQAMGRFHRAAERYRQAALTFERLGARVTAARARLGEAEVRAALGEVGDALRTLAALEAEAVERGADGLVFEARLVIARLEMALGHDERAMAVAAATIPHCEAAGRLDDAGRLAAVRAIAATGRGDPAAADLVEEADRRLRGSGLTLARAELVAELARRGHPAEVAVLRRAASRLDRHGMRVQADLARLAAAARLHESGQVAEAAAACRRVLSRRHASVWPRVSAHTRLGLIHRPTAPGRASRHLRRAVTLAETVRGRLTSDLDRAAFAAQVTPAVEELVAILLERADARSRRQAFELVGRVKSRTLLEGLDRRASSTWRDRPAVLRRWREVRRELAAALTALDRRHDGGARYANRALAERVRVIARDLEQLELEVGRAEPQAAAVLGLTESPDLRAVLEPGEVVVETFLTGEDLVVFEVDRSRIRVHRRRGLRPQLEATIRSLRFQLSKAGYGRRHLEAAPRLVDQVRRQLAELGEAVLGPTLARTTPVRLVVAPHGMLHHVPVAALEVEGEPVVGRCPVAVVPAAAVLGRLLRQRAPAPRTVGVAGAAQEGLEGIDAEVKAVAAAIAAPRAMADATVAEVVRLLETCDAVHLAAHGAFQPFVPAGSGLRLADGWLTAVDLVGRPLAARLVTVGACSSGEIGLTPGDEPAGLIRALLLGGVRSAVLAVGVVDDDLARAAAGDLYSRLAAAGPGEALRRSQLELRREHPHPALWAAFQLFGDPRPWEPR